jgi:ElaB/YqjD/DUF883 family membrane-anchored ribosome-binding protein
MKTAMKKDKVNLPNENKIEAIQELASEKLTRAAKNLHTKTDEVQDFLGEKVDKAEDLVRKKTYEAGDFTKQRLEKANLLGHKTADIIKASSQYVKDFNAQEAKEKVVTQIKNKPEMGIAVAGIFGVLIGYLIGKRSK